MKDSKESENLEIAVGSKDCNFYNKKINSFYSGFLVYPHNLGVENHVVLCKNCLKQYENVVESDYDFLDMLVRDMRGSLKDFEQTFFDKRFALVSEEKRKIYSYFSYIINRSISAEEIRNFPERMTEFLNNSLDVREILLETKESKTQYLLDTYGDKVNYSLLDKYRLFKIRSSIGINEYMTINDCFFYFA